MHEAMLTATKEFTWDMAHVLADHRGLCQNLHGHTYKMEVTVTRAPNITPVIENGPSAGMVTDFKHLKQLVQEILIDALDHATVIDISNDDEFEAALYHLLKTHGKKIYTVTYRPTAENMALDFYQILNAELHRHDACFKVSRIRLYETPTSYAEIAI